MASSFSKLKIFTLFLTCLLAAGSASSQVSISGTSCVIAGTQYTYTLSGWDHNSAISNQWTINGGQISTTGTGGWSSNATISNTPLPTVYVIWATGATHTLQETSSTQGTTSMTATLTTTLAGGTFTANQTQTVNYNVVPATISCGAASGGTCSPAYTYQWQQSSDGGTTYSDSVGATAQNLSFSAVLPQTMLYKRKVTETVTNTTAYSAVATVTVTPAPLIPGASSPTYQYTNNYTAPPITINVLPASLATCTGNSCYSYQWQSSTNGSTWTDITGAIGLTYNPGSYLPVTTTYYRLRVMAGGQTQYSITDTIATENCVLNGPVDCWNGQTATYYYTGGNPANYSWSATTGFATVIGGYLGVGNFTVKWTGTGLLNIVLNNNGTFTTLQVYVHNLPLAPGKIGKAFANLEQTSPISITTYPQAATGGTCSGVFSYQWQSSTDSINYSNIPGDTLTGMTITPTQNTYYRKKVTCGSSAAYSDTTYIALNPYFNPGTIAAGSTDSIAFNSIPLPITGTLPSGGIDTAYRYQWEYSIDAVNYYQLSNLSQGQNFQPADPLASNIYYRRKVTNGETTRYTNAVLILVKKVLFDPGTISPYTSVINAGTSPALTGSAATGGTVGTYTYQWQQSYDETNWTNCSGGTTQNYTPAALSRTTYYRRSVTNGAQSAYSNAGSYFSQVKVKVRGALLAAPTISPTPITAYSYPALTNTMVNYVRSWDIGKPTVTTLAAAKALTSINDYRQTTTYFDDYGREIQSVAKQVTPIGNDLITTENYDTLGRLVQKFLPYTDSTNAGNFRTNANLKQGNLYNSIYGGQESFYYHNTVYESAPLNRIFKETSPGNNWTGNNVGTRKDYTFNSTLDSVKIWSIGNNITDVPSVTGAYPAGALTLVVTTDEQENKVMEYADKDGKPVLKKVQLSDTLFNGYYGWISTYYVYDNFNRLRYIISPMAVEYARNNSWSVIDTVLNGLCFKNVYDARGRQIIKKVPGAAEEWMVYDARDRQVFKQDANLRGQNQWVGTLYDMLNRPVMTGLLNYTASRDSLQKLVSVQTDSTINTTRITTNASSLPSNLLLNANPTTGNFQATNSIGLATGFAVPPGTTFSATIASGSTGSDTVQITSSPIPPGASFNTLTITYYDNYNWVSSTGTSLTASLDNTNTGNSNYFMTTYNTSPTYAVPIIQNQTPRGSVTGTMALVLGSANQYVFSADYYDDHARMIQTQSINFTKGRDVVTTQYDFSGKPLRALLAHQKSGMSVEQHMVLTKLNYDAAFRAKSIFKNIDGNSTDQLIDSAQYNELGQLRAKYLGLGLDSLIYDYNIRGWLTGINRKYVGGGSGNYFGTELGYDIPASVAGSSYTPLYNGNIAGLTWKSAGDSVKRKYDFTYDNVNRLTAANFLQNPSSGWSNSVVDYTVNNLYYDLNGNIVTMNQKGFKLNASSLIDSLKYTYQGNSNKLNQVTDGANDTASLLGDFHYKGTKLSSDYSYNGNGNLVADSNKAIDNITYNYLQLPQQVHMKGKGNILYTYDASGNKLSKLTMDSAARRATTTLYVSGFVYQQGDTITNPNGGADTLQFMAHEEGRARWAYHTYYSGNPGYKWEYDLFEKDHLGNTRMVLTQQKDTTQYIATMEAAYRTRENALFYNIPQTNYSRVTAGYPVDTTTTNPNDSVCMLNGNPGHLQGPAIILKVMVGDIIDVGARSYYTSLSGTGTNPSITDVLNSLASGIVGMTAGAKGTLGQLNNTGSPLYAALNSFITNNDPNPTGKPKAYLNWMLLDNQFKYDSIKSSAVPVGNFSAGTLGTPGHSGIVAGKSGYLYVWVSNETANWPVYFDNMSVKVRSGPVLEETHFYPFGLTMAGISDKALKGNYAENKYKFNKGAELQNKEFGDGSGLEMYATQLRELDPQLGRWWQVDPRPDMSESPYASMGNNPILHNDPLGDTISISFATSLFGKKMTVNYNNGTLTNRDGSAYKGKINGFLKSSVNALNKINGTADGSKVVTALESSKNNFVVTSANDREDKPGTNQFVPIDNDKSVAVARTAKKQGDPPGAGGSGGIIYWNPNGTPLPVVGDDEALSPITDLAHEMFHAYESNVGMMDTDPPEGTELSRSEFRASFFENQIRVQLDPTKPFRTVYHTKDPADNPITVKILDASGCPIYHPPTFIPPAMRPINLIY